MTNIDGPQYVRRETYVDPLTVDPLNPAQQGPVVGDPRVVVAPQVVAAPHVESVAMAQPPVVVAPAAQVRTVAAPAGVVQTAYSRRFAPDAMIAALVGLVLLVIGLLAVVRGGFDGPMQDPVVQVLGFTHTTTLGLIEVVLGVSLLISGASSSRAGAIFFGSLLGIAAFVGAVQTKSFVEPLALESGLAWLLVIAGVVVVASALLMPRFVTRSTALHQLQ